MANKMEPAAKVNINDYYIQNSYGAHQFETYEKGWVEEMNFFCSFGKFSGTSWEFLC